jgi:CBS domain containing-hemolysin-like protein
MALSEDRQTETQASSSAGGSRRRGRMARKRSLIRRLWALWVDGEKPQGAPAETPPSASDEAAAELVDHAEAFASLRVADVMTPRADIAALEISTPLSDVVRCFVEVEHSRMPIYRETLDDPVGVVHIKDLFKLIAPTETEPERAPRTAWKDPILNRLKREMLYIPASMRAADLLVRMRAARIHMAMVIDEYGGADGLVTLEDLLEAVVGEIDDEHDEETAVSIIERPGGVYEVEARAPLETLEALLGVELSEADGEEDIDTVGGLVVALANRVPQRGEVIVHPAGYEFEVVDADPRRVRRLRVRPPAEGAPVGAADAPKDTPVAETVSAPALSAEAPTAADGMGA